MGGGGPISKACNSEIMKIIFFGTPDYVLPILKILNKDYEITAVVTQPPKPTGRKQFLVYSPVDTWAYKRSLASSGGKKDITILRDLDIGKFPEADLGICAAYGKIIPEQVIKSFKFGILNIHPSLLPKYRGASPIPAAVKNGDSETGVTIIKMDEKIDHGPVVTQFKEDILTDDTTEDLRARLFERSAKVLSQLIPAYVAGRIKPKKQDDAQATFTRILKKEDGFIDLTTRQSPITTYNFIRAMFPWPCAWSRVKINTHTSRIKLLKAHIGENKLVLDEVQLEGKDPVSWKQFTEGYPNYNFSV